MKNLFTAIFVFLAFTLQAQLKYDKVYTGGKVIECIVKEITTDAVKYIYPNEEFINTIYKTTVSKIEFISGRVETFSESASFQLIKSGHDWEKVNITQVEYEIKGLFKLGNVSAKAKGTTEFSNMNRVKSRSIKKLKIQAAMMGANTIYMTQLNTKGNVYGTKYQSAESTETNSSGIAYSNTMPSFSEFQKIYEKNDVFIILEKHYLGNSNAKMKITQAAVKAIRINQIKKENGLINVYANIKGEKTNVYRVCYFDKDSIVLIYTHKGKIFNLVLVNNTKSKKIG